MPRLPHAGFIALCDVDVVVEHPAPLRGYDVGAPSDQPNRIAAHVAVFIEVAAGRHQLPFVTMGAILGGNVHVGLEDNLYLGKGQLAASNTDQVRKIRRILEELSLEIATPDDARRMLGTKGADRTAF